MNAFVNQEMPRRILGNACVLLCGESNGVRHSRQAKEVRDDHGVRAAIPSQVHVVLNPIHDRMIRYEMPLKRRFFSAEDRWVVSVWNKGRGRDGCRPAWQVFHDGEEVQVAALANDLDLELGIVEIR